MTYETRHALAGICTIPAAWAGMSLLVGCSDHAPVAMGGGTRVGNPVVAGTIVGTLHSPLPARLS